MAIAVRLIDHTHDPIRSLYIAFRTCYSSLTPQQILDRIESGKISPEQMLRFVNQRLQTGHTSPLEQVWFEFVISGVSRAFSHQFVRHRMGISFEQQSQRYVVYKDGRFPYSVPDTVVRAGLAEEFAGTMSDLGQFYDRLVKAGIPAEDARFVLPNATSTNFKVTVNFQELLHIADQRLCLRAQWEFRQVVSKMRAELHRRFPELGRHLQPKCGELRWGYCDEDLKAWGECPIGKKRPHKTQVFALYDTHRQGQLAPLAEADMTLIETRQ